MQSFVRRVDPESGVLDLRDVPAKKEIAELCEVVKVDVVEAEILTGTKNLEKAAEIMEEWGTREAILTGSEGVFARYRGKTFFREFTNRNSQGRTGRGDTTMGAYLAWRIDHDVPESLRFAAAMASIKMESQGPFRGSLEDVFARM